MPQRLANIPDVDGVDPEVGAPQELHLLVQLLIDRTTDEPGGCFVCKLCY